MATNSNCNVQVIYFQRKPKTAIVMCKYYAVKGAPNSNCDVQVPSFQSSPTTTSNEQIKKSFTSTSIPKKIVG